ncbi:hypothetical protein Flexsi_0425 [Flexistipes sinusarabici DSM 4947]|uniref:Uncharacterized protein n=1 Tax=Flexistipes sinusarabici (strain ATCC 49648 / DSM 4947 / MAS 10) TaxID=717231 RepID=F8E8Y9_FLESM|nr:hypothetical protein [Flexistipes sinusarabici]AEI14113.1 hypothetical protein Flexsi_0425 [Flexistipes sinusarabici DSM 4947]
MSGHEIILSYLEIILSPQVVISSVIVVFLLIFRVALAALIDRVASIKWGPAELSAPQPLSDRRTMDGEVSGDDTLGESADSDLPEGVNVSEEDARRLRQAMQSERARAHLWEYRFLNLFLVLNTQRVLDWIAGLPDPPTFTMYDAWWQQVIPTAEQRRTIIQVLEDHNLIVIKGDLIEITPKGREYIEWRGPLPGSPVQAKRTGHS